VDGANLMVSYKKKYEELLMKVKRLKKERDDWHFAAVALAISNFIVIVLFIAAILHSAGF